MRKSSARCVGSYAKERVRRRIRQPARPSQKGSYQSVISVIILTGILTEGVPALMIITETI